MLENDRFAAQSVCASNQIVMITKIKPKNISRGIVSHFHYDSLQICALIYLPPFTKRSSSLHKDKVKGVVLH